MERQGLPWVRLGFLGFPWVMFLGRPFIFNNFLGSFGKIHFFRPQASAKLIFRLFWPMRAVAERKVTIIPSFMAQQRGIRSQDLYGYGAGAARRALFVTVAECQGVRLHRVADYCTVLDVRGANGDEAGCAASHCRRSMLTQPIWRLISLHSEPLMIALLPVSTSIASRLRGCASPQLCRHNACRM